jgi:predicted nucleic acid-binding protein
LNDRYLIDSNIWIDIFTNDPVWCKWSEEKLRKASEFGIFINPIIFSEVSIPFENSYSLEMIFKKMQCQILPLPISAAFVAGKAFVQYRKKSKSKSSPLPDFFIGAHAQVEKMILITRDVKRYRNYFPDVQLISP